MPAQRKTQPASLVEHLAEQAPRKAVNSLLGVSKYYVSADLLLRQADCYRKEANEEQQYVMLMRFASLLLETIPSHKDYNRSDPKYVQLKKVLVDRCFPELERLKLALRAKDVVDPQAHSRNRPQEAVQTAYSNLPGVNWGSQVQPSAPPMPAMQDLRVDDLLDIIQHGPGSSAPPPPPPPPSYGQQGYGSSAPALPVVPVYQPKYASSGGDRRHTLFFSPGGSSTTSPPQQQQYGDPSAPPYRTSSQGALAPQLPRYPGLEAYQQLAVQQALPPTAGPSLGPQEVAVISVPADMQGRPDTCTAPHPSYGQQQQPREAPPPPPSAPSASSGGVRELVKRAALRDVHVSVALMEEFLAYARSNTSRGIESCGILAGRLSANDSIFTICTLIIPKQQGTTDTVQALNEEEIFEVQFSQELYPMGWIHTHPTQTCFLSSVDVHTHAGYQTMLDEAVAIVMAPTDRSKKCGIFRLSTPGGLQLVQRCNLRGFHAHPETATGQELYELCGHVFLNPRAKHTVVDLR